MMVLKNIYNEKWLSKNTSSLSGKTVAVTGSTGGLGGALCRYLGYLGASLILIDRNQKRSAEVKNALVSEFPEISVKCINADLEDISSVRSACKALLNEPIDVFIHNAGAYSIPRKICTTGYDNVFQINFVSPYYIIKDNDNSRIRILKINNFSSIEEIVHDKMLTKALVVDNFFDTNYMKKIKREAVKYPVAKELEI